MRDNPNTQSVIVVLKLHLVVPLKLASTHCTHLLNREIEDNRLLNPLVYLPLALLEIDWLCTTKLTLIYRLDNCADSLAGNFILKQRAILPRRLYNFL